MLQILAITAPLYLTIALGFGVVRTGLLRAEYIDGLGQYVLRIGLPVMVFHAILSAGNTGGLDTGVMLGHLVIALPLLILGRFTLMALTDSKPDQSWSLSLGMANPNTVMIGFPLASIAFPDQAALVFSSLMLVENLFIVSTSILGADMAGAKPKGVSQTLRTLARSLVANPLLIAVLLGLLARSVQLDISGPINDSLMLIRQTGPGLALFYVGATVARFRVGGAPKVVGLVTLFKLILHPILAALIFPLFITDPSLLAACILCSSVPMLTIYPLLARTSGCETIAATTLLVATTASFATVSVVLYML